MEAERTDGEPEVGSELRIGDGGDSRGMMSGEINRDAVAFPMVKCGKDSFSVCHRHAVVPAGRG